MKVIINTDHNITLTEASIGELESQIGSTLDRFDSHLTRVEAHLSDASAGRSTGDDIRCQLEARPKGRGAEFATHDASSTDEAVSGALRKLVQVLDSTFGRLDQRKGGRSMGEVDPR
jgi:hypothetical protein